MKSEHLRYLSEKTLLELKSDIDKNLARYENGDFTDLARDNGWAIEHALTVDLSPLQKLTPNSGAESEIRNSLVVWESLGKLPPALAAEERIWVRLTHIECLEFCRQRWLRATDNETKLKLIKTHFFAVGRNGIRDDNGISRLWWNAYIAGLAMPHDMESGLQLILKKADIRASLIERPRTVSRPALAAAIVRAMQAEPWITEAEINFRTFMKIVNKFGGGRLFEVMPIAQIDSFIAKSVRMAREEQNALA